MNDGKYLVKLVECKVLTLFEPGCGGRMVGAGGPKDKKLYFGFFWLFYDPKYVDLLSHILIRW